MTIRDLIKMELYFDDCLIKLYNILASENELTETVANTFYYMLKKQKKEGVSKGENSLFFDDFIRTPLREHFQIFNSPEDKSTFDTSSICCITQNATFISKSQHRIFGL
jgi:hypothetical protein